MSHKAIFYFAPLGWYIKAVTIVLKRRDCVDCELKSIAERLFSATLPLQVVNIKIGIWSALFISSYVILFFSLSTTSYNTQWTDNIMYPTNIFGLIDVRLSCPFVMSHVYPLCDCFPPSSPPYSPPLCLSPSSNWGNPTPVFVPKGFKGKLRLVSAHITRLES